MANTSESGCCGSARVTKADEQASATERQEKGHCGCEGEKQKVDALAPAITDEAVSVKPTTRAERNRGCC
jgi:hypothetical protein